MELKTTEEFVKAAYSAACTEWKQKLENEFPDVFKNVLEVGEWYKINGRADYILNFQTPEKSYGFVNSNWDTNRVFKEYHRKLSTKATDKEVERLLIKKGGYEIGSKTQCLDSKMNATLTSEPYYSEGRLHAKTDSLASGYVVLFKDGKFAEVFPEDKITITLEKVKDFLAEKYMTSPEQIEIKL